MKSNITIQSVRQQLRQCRGDVAALEGLLGAAGPSPPTDDAQTKGACGHKFATADSGRAQ